jgi:hypothetical protein
MRGSSTSRTSSATGSPLPSSTMISSSVHTLCSSALRTAVRSHAGFGSQTGMIRLTSGATDALAAPCFAVGVATRMIV